ncbi:MAG: 50S ribosomal protein L29 [Euryarchaeota archaeon]|nr:50S ribosomal protein L29 [Euryarchaeota archaeon]NAS88462.1 50S ribosomal protein L29 [ANME-1 cluster archaeon AG-394-G21]CBH36870.1 ribosomal protein L29 [uncultured archaeon]
MSIFRMEEIRKMGEQERQEELESLMKDLLHERGMIATGGAPDNPSRIGEIRKAIARIKTVRGEKGREEEK